MKAHKLISTAIIAVAILALCVIPVAAQQNPTSTVPVRMIVTAEGNHNSAAPAIGRDDVAVYQGKKRAQVAGWEPLEGNSAGLELFILIDDSATSYLGTQFSSVRDFINSQPPTTQIAVGYMRNGTVSLAQNFTADHAAAAKALRLPLGVPTVNGSPYFTLMNVLKRWQPSSERHEILMVTNGVDPYDRTFEDPYVDEATEQAQRTGTVIYSIYLHDAGRFNRGFWGAGVGQSHLMQLAEATGGEAYFLWYTNPVSFTPYLNDISARLNHQYLLTALLPAPKKAGIQPVKVTIENSNAKITTPNSVYVPTA
jgi:hypothetical protein